MENENLRVYNKVKQPPENALSPIKGGKLGSMKFTDIKPMWRIKAITEVFGPAGIGWYPEIVREWTEEGAEGERIAFVKMNLYVYDYEIGEWGRQISAIGSNKLTKIEKGKLVTNDDAYKGAYTDAFGVAAKMLGVGASVYWANDNESKYTQNEDNQEPKTEPIVCPVCKKEIKGFKSKGKVVFPEAALNAMGMCLECYQKKKAVESGEEAS